MKPSAKAATGTAKSQDRIAMDAALNILDKWSCTPEQQQAILQVSRAALYKYRNPDAAVSLSRDQTQRISYLLNIHAALRLVFENPNNVYGFMAMANDNPYFNGRSPLEIIATGDFGALYEVSKRIDVLRGGLW